MNWERELIIYFEMYNLHVIYPNYFLLNSFSTEMEKYTNGNNK